jgi:hypothetical protein
MPVIPDRTTHDGVATRWLASCYSPPMSDTPVKPALSADLARLLAEASRADEALAGELESIAADLRAEGHHVHAAELEEAHASAPLVGRIGAKLGEWTHKLREAAAHQWTLFSREVGESRELVSLLRRRLTGEIRHFSPEEEALIRRQVADLFRTVPATALALAPVPGIAVITPFVLRRLNLLPSAWREAGLIARLQQSAERLGREGHTSVSARLLKVIASLEERQRHQSDRVRTLREHPEIRELYDLNADGILDDQEWALFEADQKRLAALIASDTGEAVWFVTTDGHVGEPLHLKDILSLPLPEHALVRPSGLERWLPLPLLYDAAAALHAAA